MTLAVHRAQFEYLLDHCRKSYPEEGCGAILGERRDDDKVVTEVAPLRNLSGESRQSRFEADPDGLLSLVRREQRTGIQVLGFFHSHPDHSAEPSETDRMAAWPEYSYPIVSVVKGAVSDCRSWRLCDDGSGYDEEKIQILD